MNGGRLISRSEVAERLCMLTTDVMRAVHDYETPADCHCGKRTEGPTFQFDETIITFIEEAVRAAIKETEQCT
jgi:hypothetical protein